MKISKLVTSVGLIITVASVALWAYNFGNIDSLSCLYENSLSCGVINTAAVINGSIDYNPLMFIGGVSALVVGMVLKFLKK